MTFEATPTTVAPGGTIAISGQCAGQWANISAYVATGDPNEPYYSLEVQYLVRPDGTFEGGFVLPSVTPVGTGEMRATCQSGDAYLDSSGPVPLTVTGEPGGAFEIALAVTPTTVVRGGSVQVSGRCINNGIPTSTARVWAIGPWFEYTHTFTDHAVDADGSFSGELSFPIEHYDRWHVYADCRNGDDVVGLYSNGFGVEVEDPEGPDPPDVVPSPPATPARVAPTFAG